MSIVAISFPYPHLIYSDSFIHVILIISSEMLPLTLTSFTPIHSCYLNQLIRGVTPYPHLINFSPFIRVILIISSGMLRYADGRVYEGLWREDQKHGMGEQRWTHGHVYSGMWNRDMREGMGTMSYPDGSTYKGNLRVT